jgi:hypothetical protein
MPAWKKFTWFGLVVAGTLLLLTFLVWALCQYGTLGLIEVTGPIRIVFIVLACYAVALPLLAFLDVYIAARRPAGKIRLPSAYILVLAVVAIIIPSLLLGWLVPAPSQRVGDKAVQLLMADGSGKYGTPDMAVTFWTINPSQNTIKWDSGGAVSIISEEKPSNQHAFMLRDLQPATAYRYSLNDSKEMQFTTPPGKGQPLHFAVGSDSHFGASTARHDLTGKMLQQISDPAHGYQMFFLLGDKVELGFDDSHWQEAIQALSATTSTMPTRPLVGNHDTLFGGLNLDQEYMYPQQMDVKSGSSRWQRIDVNDVHFLMLDLEWGTQSYSAEQAAWLEKQLSLIPREDWCIVMSHCFYYSSGGYWGLWDWYDEKDTISELAPLFEKYGVDLVFSGHNHLLELLQKNSVTYAICGAFGGQPDPERSYVSPASIWYQGGSPAAFLDVTLTADNATITFRDPDYNQLKSLTVTR